MDVREELLSLGNPDKVDFQAKLIPGDHKFLGAKLPDMRALAKKTAKGDWRGYVDNWEGEYFEDYGLYALVIAYAKMDIDERLEQYRKFIPLIDNWAVCDSFCGTWKPKKEEERSKLWDFALGYTKGTEFEMRYAVITMLSVFIDDEHIDRVIEEMDSAQNDGYYLKMAVAWTLSVCYVKYPEKTMAYLKGKNNLDDFTYNKALQKIVESYRVDDETKKIIRSMKRK